MATSLGRQELRPNEVQARQVRLPSAAPCGARVPDRLRPRVCAGRHCKAARLPQRSDECTRSVGSRRHPIPNRRRGLQAEVIRRPGGLRLVVANAPLGRRAQVPARDRRHEAPGRRGPGRADRRDDPRGRARTGGPRGRERHAGEPAQLSLRAEGPIGRRGRRDEGQAGRVGACQPGGGRDPTGREAGFGL